MPQNLTLPGNPRYQPKQMAPIFGYDNLYHWVAAVEIATLKTLHEIKVIPDSDFADLLPEVEIELLNIPTTAVDKIERQITHHDIRAWVRQAQEIIGKKLSRWVHVPLTSYDPIDTGRMLQFREAYEKALKPAIGKVVLQLAEMTEKAAAQIQIGRTHGQHALPITVGFWLASILSRILYNWKMMDAQAAFLVGKISGAVGAHNAQNGLGFCDNDGNNSFEKLVLGKLSLKPAPVSTQIVPPEPLGYFLFTCTMMSASLAQFGRDCRHLMRSEIAEISESFEIGQVGSSTMAHKRNPINFENLEGTWLKTKNEFGKVLDTLISEHQRDLVGSSVARDYPIIPINLQHQLNTLTRQNTSGVSFLERIVINTDACKTNFQMSSHLITAEPLYIALQMAGYQGDAHKLVNQSLVPPAAAQKEMLITVLEKMAENDSSLMETINRIPEDIKKLLRTPEKYTGDSAKIALETAARAKQTVSDLMS